MVALWIVLGVLTVALICLIGMFNGLVRTRNACDESWSDVDTELRRRYDLVPNMVETVKGYAAHERDVFERVTRARQTAHDNQGSPDSQAGDENQLIANVRDLLAVVENYPDLKASEHFRQLMEELSTTEDRIARARRFYNGNVRDLSNRIEVFPSNVIASLFSFSPREYFEIEDHIVRAAPIVEMDN